MCRDYEMVECKSCSEGGCRTSWDDSVGDCGFSGVGVMG